MHVYRVLECDMLVTHKNLLYSLNKECVEDRCKNVIELTFFFLQVFCAVLQYNYIQGFQLFPSGVNYIVL